MRSSLGVCGEGHLAPRVTVQKAVVLLHQGLLPIQLVSSKVTISPATAQSGEKARGGDRLSLPRQIRRGREGVMTYQNRCSVRKQVVRDRPRLRKTRSGAGGVIKIVTQTVSRATLVEHKSRNRFQPEEKGEGGQVRGGRKRGGREARWQGRAFLLGL